MFLADSFSNARGATFSISSCGKPCAKPRAKPARQALRRMPARAKRMHLPHLETFRRRKASSHLPRQGHPLPTSKRPGSSLRRNKRFPPQQLPRKSPRQSRATRAHRHTHRETGMSQSRRQSLPQWPTTRISLRAFLEEPIEPSHPQWTHGRTSRKTTRMQASIPQRPYMPRDLPWPQSNQASMPPFHRILAAFPPHPDRFSESPSVSFSADPKPVSFKSFH